MVELKNITDKILQDAKMQAQEILNGAHMDYNAIVAEYRQNAETQSAQITEQARTESERLTSRAISAAAQNRAQALLSEKMALIEQTAELAKSKILNADDKTYMGYLETLLTQKADGTAGEILMNEKDKNRISKGFFEKIKAKNLVLATENAHIAGGFILRFGMIEENCDIEALFREKQEKLVDITSQMLFKTEGQA